MRVQNKRFLAIKATLYIVGVSLLCHVLVSHADGNKAISGSLSLSSSGSQGGSGSSGSGASASIAASSGSGGSSGGASISASGSSSSSGGGQGEYLCILLEYTCCESLGKHANYDVCPI